MARHERRVRGATLSLVWTALCLVLMALPAAAQFSSISRPSSSLSRASSSSRPAPTSTQPAWETAPTVLLRDETTVYNVTLNRTRPAVLAQFANPVADKPVTVHVFIGALGMDKNALPLAIATTADDFQPDRSRNAKATGGNDVIGFNLGRDPSWELAWNGGFANWTYGVGADGRAQSHDAVTPTVFLGIGIDTDGRADTGLVGAGNVLLHVAFRVHGKSPTHISPGDKFNATAFGGLDAAKPVFADSTATQALVFSPLRIARPIDQPTYPNYTLPGAEMALPEYGVARLNDSAPFAFGRNASTQFIVIPTNVAPPTNLHNSAFAVRAAWDGLAEADRPNETLADTVWTPLGGAAGFRDYALFNNLKPGTNYTAWVFAQNRGPAGVTNQPTLSSPIYFTTKPAGFACPLVLPTDMCPGVAYTSPLATDPDTPLTAIPEEYASFLTSSLQAFQVSVLSGACGRDHYSFVSSCADCYAAYREWLCRIVLPQCAPASNAFVDVDAKGPQAPFTIDRTQSTPRNGNLSSEDTLFPTYPIDYVELQPCISTCTFVDGKCPATLQWNCPHRHFNANESYAFIGGSNNKGDGTARTGWPATDAWGNRWCNGL